MATWTPGPHLLPIASLGDPSAPREAGLRSELRSDSKTSRRHGGSWLGSRVRRLRTDRWTNGSSLLDQRNPSKPDFRGEAWPL